MTEIRQNTNIGTSSLILVFIVLCLATFGLLSWSNAKSDWNLAQKNKEAVTVYYLADAKGEEFVAMIDQAIKESGVCLESKLIATEIPMNFGQVLCIELQYAEDLSYEILAWKVYNQDEYEIDDSLPVWAGE